MPYAIQRLGHAFPVLRPVRVSLVHVPLGPCPSLHQLRRRLPTLVRRLHHYYYRSCLLVSVHRRLRLLTFPTRAGQTTVHSVRHEISQSLPRRRPGFRRVPFVRDGIFDHDRASAPRIAVPHMLPSAGWTASASVTLTVSRLNSPPLTIAVYASWPPSPTDSRNTRYQAGAAPYLDRTSTGWNPPASWRTHPRLCCE